MPDLASRAEEALLGALIAQPDQITSVSSLEAADFTDPARQAVWTAIKRLSDIASGATGPEFADVIHATSDNDHITYDYLTRLAVAAPTPGAADVYARMVLEANLIRDFADDLANRAGTGQDGDAAVSDAAASYSRNITAAREAAADDLREPGPPPADPGALREERFLAALMRQPDLTEWISLDPDTLTSSARRDIYQAIVALNRHGEPIDDLTLAWALARSTATRDVHEGRTTTPESFAAAIPPGTIARLAATSTDTVTALEIGRDLLADHARAQIAAAVNGSPQRHTPTVSPTTTEAQQRRMLASGTGQPLLQPPQQQNPSGPQLRQEGS